MKIILLAIVLFNNFKGSKQQLSMRSHGGEFRLKNFKHSHRYRLNVAPVETLERDRDVQCLSSCVKNKDCVSLNVKTTTSNKFHCELLNVSKFHNPDNLTQDETTVHWYLEDPCVPYPCNSGTCSRNDSETNSYTCTCPAGVSGKQCDIYKSCKIASSVGNRENGTYKIEANVTQGYTEAYCIMTSLPGCSGEGWTLVMKIDGAKATFNYSSPYWSNKESYNVLGGQTAFDDQETKLPTYYSTSFQQLCIGMKVGNDLKFLSINYPASSLYSVIADDVYRSTNVGQSIWKSLVSSSILQPHCLQEGFNVKSGTRIESSVDLRLGIIGNNENHCGTPDSFIGLGGRVFMSYTFCDLIPMYPNINVAGNVAYCVVDIQNERYIKAIAYVLVR